MLINRHQTVHLSLISTDVPLWHTIQTEGSMFQKEQEVFHLVLNQQNLPHSLSSPAEQSQLCQGVFWLEISPYRVIMTMQSNANLSYRHFWEQGVYGISRYCLSTGLDQPSQAITFRNFTRYLKVDSNPFPHNVRLEYEMWSGKTNLGSYILHLAIDQ